MTVSLFDGIVESFRQAIAIVRFASDGHHGVFCNYLVRKYNFPVLNVFA